MYTPRYLSQFNQAKLLARLEALESEVAAMNRAPRARRASEPTRDEVEKAGADVREEIKRIEAEDAKRAAEDKRLRMRREFIDRHTRTPFEEYWDTRYGPQPTLLDLPVGSPSEAARALRFAPGTPSEHLRTIRLDRGIFGTALSAEGMPESVRSMLTRPADRETTGREILDSIERAKATILKQNTDDRTDCVGYLTRAMFETLAADKPSQELRRPLTGKKPTTVILDDVDSTDRITPAEEQSIRQSIMDNAAKALKEAK